MICLSAGTGVGTSQVGSCEVVLSAPEAKEFAVTATPQEIYQRYLWASAITRDADALAELFSADGVYEAPLVPTGHAFPSRLAGREEIRTAMAAYYQRSAGADLKVDAANSRYVVHPTADPDVFIVEIDAAFHGMASMSLVQIFRIHDDEIVLLRDYFAPEWVD
jgi:limonene-1,2-epoxide hydrolase